MPIKIARALTMVFTAAVLIQAGACNLLDATDSVIDSRLIDTEYPQGMTVANGRALPIILVNESVFCLEFPISDTIPIFVYVDDGAAQIQNMMVYTSQSLKMSPLNSSAARKEFGVSPFIDPKAARFTLPLYSAYVTLSGHVCEDSKITVTRKVPFFIQYFVDY